MKFKARQLTQMANDEILIDMGWSVVAGVFQPQKKQKQGSTAKHELQQIEVSKSDTSKRKRMLTAKEMTRYRGGLRSVGWLFDNCCLRDRLKVNKMIRSAKSTECKLKILIFPITIPPETTISPFFWN